MTALTVDFSIESVKISGAPRTTLHRFQDEKNFQTMQGWQWRSVER
jgi:hypothetical protein